MGKFALSAAAFISCCTVAMAQSVIQGRATTLDGDTLAVQGQAVRLNGIDAPELNAPRGVTAKSTMARIIGDRVLTCTLNGERSYNRVIGVCALPDGTDIGAELVRLGFALDCARYSGGRYASAEPAGVRSQLRPAPYC